MISNKSFVIVLSILLSYSLSSKAQLGGSKTYMFLNMANSARVSALGGNYVPIYDNDITLAYSNPSLINEKMHGQFSLNYLNYFEDVNAGFVAYGHEFNKIGTFVATLQFLSYGDFIERDEVGRELGSFRASEYALTIGWAKKLSDHFQIGVNLKNIYSKLEIYKSYGIAADLALSYINEEKHLTSSFIVKNIGRQITTYNGGDREPIPFEIQWGVSKKFEHAPFRLVLLLNDLQKWDLTYTDPNKEPELDPFTGEPVENSSGWHFGDKLMRHAIFGVELAPGKGNFLVQLAYNYRRRQELKIASRTALVGFSFGFGIKISKFKLSYSHANYHLAGGTNTFTITTNFSDFLK
ncbi:MAG: type IX secretion system protein PorQ [Bacteroidales bacterium]|nr:type IX secretion system protein PorQ [Bacteroidales bacterium]